MRRLMHSHGGKSSDVGMLQVSSSTVLDRSKNLKTELMTLVSAGSGGDTEGVSHYGASACGLSTLQGCVGWTQGGSWDGRWAVAP